MDLKGVSLFLIGMMGSGKTTVGRLLAAELNYQFFDTDALIEQLTGQTITEIFATAGEETFRHLETQVLAELSAYKNLAIATGGGIVLNPHNWSYLHHGLVIWLEVPEQTLAARLQGDRRRPLLAASNPQQQLREILAQRQPFYAQADLRVSVSPDQAPDQVVAQVLAAIPPILRPEVQPNDSAFVRE